MYIFHSLPFSIPLLYFFGRSNIYPLYSRLHGLSVQRCDTGYSKKNGSSESHVSSGSDISDDGHDEDESSCPQDLSLVHNNN